MMVENRTDTYRRTSRCTARRVLERKYRILRFRRHSEDQSEGTINESYCPKLTLSAVDSTEATTRNSIFK